MLLLLPVAETDWRFPERVEDEKVVYLELVRCVSHRDHRALVRAGLDRTSLQSGNPRNCQSSLLRRDSAFASVHR